MTRALDVLGVLLLLAFCIVWPPAWLLLGGVVVLGLAQTRRANQSKAKGGQR